MERNLQETTEMVKAILGSIEEGIHAVNCQGITIYYNEVAAKLDGLQPEEVIGKHVLDVFPSLMVETSTLLKVIKTGKAIYHQPQTYTNFRGNKVHTINTTLPIRSQGQLIGALEVSRDLTYIKELTEKWIDLQARMMVPSDNKKNRSSTWTQVSYTLDDILSVDPSMIQLKERARRAAATSSPVLVYGETGTGKELIVQGIHQASHRKKKPFIAQNCAALPASLLESILFGTVKGSFTGAENRPGLFELAHEGTLFLDEINSMPLELQAKLLRVLQEGWIRRVGDTKVIPVDVRILVATNADPLLAMEQGSIRPDLYYRVNVVSLHIPPLRTRKGDLELLLHHFIKKYNVKFGLSVKGVDKDAKRILHTYDWPGNVRELEHAIEGAMNQVSGEWIEGEHLPCHIMSKVERLGKGHHHRLSPQDETEPFLHHVKKNMPGYGGIKGKSLREALQEVEGQMIRMALQETGGNIKQASRRLGIPRQTLQYKLGKMKERENQGM